MMLERKVSQHPPNKRELLWPPNSCSKCRAQALRWESSLVASDANAVNAWRNRREVRE